jgi:hypothetical protein
MTGRPFLKRDRRPYLAINVGAFEETSARIAPSQHFETKRLTVHTTFAIKEVSNSGNFRQGETFDGRVSKDTESVS